MASNSENHKRNDPNQEEEQPATSSTTLGMITERNKNLYSESKEQSDSDAAKTKERKRRTTKVGLNDTLRRIRHLIDQGYSNPEIQDILQLEERTFYRYLKKIYEIDKALFEEQEKDALATQIRVFKDRLLRAYRWSVAITENENMHPSVRMEAQRYVVHIAWTLMKIDLEGPRFLQMARPVNNKIIP